MNYPKTRKFFFCLTVFTLAFLLCGSTSFAQRTMVTVEGTVVDEDGNFLPGASVTARNPETGYTKSVMSKDDGSYRLTGIPPGDYEIEVSLSGFATRVRKGLTLNVGGKVSIKFTLQPATLEEEVTVTATSPMVEVTKSEISSVVDREYIEDLPLLDRDWDTLSLIKAGAASSAYEGVTTAAQPRGSSELMIDGVSNEWTGTNITRIAIPADAIQEFRVITNQFAPEYGNASGLVRSAITRSGTNDFKGRLAFFYRDEGFDSSNYFVKHDRYNGPELPKDEQQKPPFNHKNFAGFVGGPIAQDKAHFFIAYDGFNRSEYSTITSPLVTKESVETPTNTHRLMAKLNFQLNEQNLITLRYGLDFNKYGNIGPGGLYTKETGIDDQWNVHDLQANWTFYPSDNTMNEVRVIYAYTKDEWSNAVSPGQPMIVRPSGIFGKIGNMPQLTREQRFSIVDNFSIFAGNHSIKMGFELSWTPLDGYVDQYKDGYFLFQTDSPFDANSFATYPLLYIYNASDTNFDTPYSGHGIFVQDSWKVSPRLTLNFGLRYSIYTISGLEIAKGDIRNLNPRFGFTWDPIGDGKTVIRGGVGSYTQNPMLNAGLIAGLMGSWELRTLYYPNYPDPFLENPFVPSIPGANLALDEYHPKKGAVAPYTVQGTFGFQREVIQDISIGADLVYAKGYRMMRLENSNGIFPGTGFIRPDMTKANVWQITDNGITEYKALYLSFKKRYSHGWLLEFSYTLADSKANVETEQTSQLDNEEDIWDRMWGPTHNDARHKISLAGVVDLPLRFQLGGTFFYQSKLPFNPLYVTDVNLDGTNTDMVGNRNSERGYDYITLNLRLSWFVNISSIRFQLFAETYNATNYTNFHTVYVRYDTDAFGEPQGAADPRLFQFGFRFDF